MWRTWFSLLCRLSSKTSDHPCAGDDHAGVLAQGAADEAHFQGAAFARVSVVPLTADSCGGLQEVCSMLEKMPIPKRGSSAGAGSGAGSSGSGGGVAQG